MAGLKPLKSEAAAENFQDEFTSPDASSPENANAKQRKDQILSLVRERGFVSIDSLAKHFSVTTQTIRRDINKLCKNGQLRRYHGGAGLHSSVENVSYTDRQVMFPYRR